MGSGIPGRLPSTLLTCHVGYCPAGVQGTILGIAVDLNALPYLLRPFPRSLPSGRPRSVGPSRLRLLQSEKSCKQGFGASPVEDAGRSRKWCLARPSSRRGRPESETGVVPPRPGLPLEDWIALLACRLGIWANLGVAYRSQHRLLGQTFAGKPIHEGPKVYEPDTY